MSGFLNLGEAIAANAHRFPDRVGARDLHRALTYREWNVRSNRLANALLGTGLAKGDRVAVLAHNRLEWLEIYAATAKAGLVSVPVNFRLVASEIGYILADSGVRALIVHEDLLGVIEELKPDLGDVTLIHIGAGKAPPGFLAFEELLSGASQSEPDTTTAPADPWAIMYTSGTTGPPKGAVQSHQSAAAIALVTALDFEFATDETALLVMPMCHANSLYFFTTFAYLGAAVCVYDRPSFDPQHAMETLVAERISFTSLVPTHYITMLDLPPAVRQAARAGSVRKLLISSASSRRDTKLGILEEFAGAQLYELYGSTEAGWVTLLRPEDQLTKLGSVGREFTGSAPIRLLDAAGTEVTDGETGELFSRTPYTFTEYWGRPDDTADAFRAGHCTVGDLARRDPEGFYYLVDRKSNLIISGGENVYPAEVENLLGGHDKVCDVAVIGIPHHRWGESVHAVVVLCEGEISTPEELMEWCQGRIAGYKRPRSIDIVPAVAMPRTATGKILHRVLRERYST